MTLSRLTVFLAKLIGLFTTVVGLCIGVHKDQSVTTIDALAHSPDVLLVFGVVALLAGLAIVLSHNVWSGGVLPVVITLLGWILVLRGVVLLFLAPETLAGLLEAMQFERLFYAYLGVTVLIGVYLTYAGFASRPPAGQSTAR
jgi:hypothetical protein